MELLRPLLYVLVGVALTLLCFVLGVDHYLPGWARFGRGEPLALSIAGPEMPGRCGVRYTIDNDTHRALFVSWNVPPAKPEIWPADQRSWEPGWRGGSRDDSLLSHSDDARPTQPDYYDPNSSAFDESRPYDSGFDTYDTGYDGSAGNGAPDDSYAGYDGGPGYETAPGGGYDSGPGDNGYPSGASGYPPPSLYGAPPPPANTPPPPTAAVALQPGQTFSTPQADSAYPASYGSGYSNCDPGAHNVTIEIRS